MSHSSNREGHRSRAHRAAAATLATVGLVLAGVLVMQERSPRSPRSTAATPGPEPVLHDAFGQLFEASHARLQTEADDAFSPEYERPLDRLTMFGFGVDDDVTRTQLSILAAAPPDASTTLLVQDPAKLSMAVDLDAVWPAHLAPPTIVAGPVTPGLDYAQDFSEGGATLQYFGVERRRFARFGGPQAPRIASALSGRGVMFHPAPFVFRGGNVFCVRDRSGVRTVLIGADSYRASVQLYREQDRELEESVFRDLVRTTFSAERVIILGRRDDDGALRLQPWRMFHLDQALLPLADGLIGIASVPAPTGADRAAIDALKSEAQRAFEAKWGVRARRVEAIHSPLHRHMPEVELMTGFPEGVSAVTPPPGLSEAEAALFQKELAMVTASSAAALVCDPLTWTTAEAVGAELDAYRAQLADFELIELPHRRADPVAYAWRTNAIVFVGAAGPIVMLPWYASDTADGGAAWDEAAAMLRLRGFEVRRVDDGSAANHRGGIHCLIGRY